MSRIATARIDPNVLGVPTVVNRRDQPVRHALRVFDVVADVTMNEPRTGDRIWPSTMTSAR